MANKTMIKFGHPNTVIGQTEHWTVQLRPEQVTLGSLVLISNEPVETFGNLSYEGFTGLKPVIGKDEDILYDMINYQKINYLMLMMVDNDVHFHVIPRYDGTREYEGVLISDLGFPGPPKLNNSVTLELTVKKQLITELRKRWQES